jgi:hypothetical protein
MHPRGGFYQAVFPPLSCLLLAPCCAGQQPSFGHNQAAPRRALLPLDSLFPLRRRPGQAKIADGSGGSLKAPRSQKAFGARDCTPTKRAPRRDENLHLVDYHRQTATPLGPLVNPS